MFGIRAGRVFDGEQMLARPTVLVDGGTIVDAGVPIPESVEIAELDAMTVLPGFVDCHQHLCFDGDGTLEEQVGRVDDEQLAERARSNARRALDGGVTTLRDLGDRAFVTLPLRDDPELPTVLAAGPPLTPPKGHCWFLGGECVDAAALDAAVRARAERGCDVVKIMVTGGAMTPTFPLWRSQFSEDDLRRVVDLAHRLDMPVAAHCHGVEGIRTSVDVGVDTIEHCTFFDDSMSTSTPPDLLDDLAASGIGVSATLGNLPGRTLPPVFAEALPKYRGAFGRIHAAGGRVVVGTDAGISRYKPHDVMAHSFADLLDIGMSPLDALRAMTSAGADAVGASGKGRLVAGRDADLVALDGDPLDDPAAIHRLRGVWRAGLAVS